MANIVLGIAAPHSGMLGKPADTWLEDGQRDRKNPTLWYRNKTWSYQQLEAERRAAGFARFLTLEERIRRHDACRKAIERLRDVYAEAKPDVAIIIGKDQREIFLDVMPTFAVHVGDTIENGPPQRPNYAPAEPIVYPGAPDLAAHILGSLQDDGFDIACMTKMPPNGWMQSKIVVPHAYGFIYHEIMRDRAPPSVPIYINTFYPPNQPSMGRSVQFGRALSRAIASWDASVRVALVASGGLSHFVCDEDFDRSILEMFKTADLEALQRVDERSYQSGTSEIKLYAPVIVAMAERKCPMTLVDYVPCYRTEAGTGEGMGFMYWKP